ncbi:MAG: (Fe-S)-binding protein [Gammaproteobacteria bacterium]|nr:(Fe-S)-binding protein [Gammaproteobacteria bacterium]
MSIQQTISQLANQCVLCGLCIPHCPTYKLFQTENESPRGRISLFKALAENQIKVSESLFTSLDHCLTCRACEKICPSQVDYATISNLGRALIASQHPEYQRSLKQKMAEKLLVTPSLHPLIKLSAKAVAPFQSFIGKNLKDVNQTESGSQSTLASIGVFSHEISSDASFSSPIKNFYPAPEASFQIKPGKKKQVILFKGCSSDLFEQQTLLDTIKLLNACLFDVYIPEKQHCCGAMNHRQGDIHGMKKLAKENIKQFKSLLQESQAIISITNSCSGQLKEYAKLMNSLDSEAELINEAEDFGQKATDIISFLAQVIKIGHLKFAPLTEEKSQRIGVHIPCSLKNVLKEDQILFDLLENIPNIQLIKINDQYCCGAAGSYMLQYPDIANRLLDEKIDDVIEQNYQTIVSSNLGCSLHFKQGLKNYEQKVGRKIEVIHPIQLLARQLIQSPQVNKTNVVLEN